MRFTKRIGWLKWWGKRNDEGWLNEEASARKWHAEGCDVRHTHVTSVTSGKWGDERGGWVLRPSQAPKGCDVRGRRVTPVTFSSLSVPFSYFLISFFHFLLFFFSIYFFLFQFFFTPFFFIFQLSFISPTPSLFLLLLFFLFSHAFDKSPAFYLQSSTNTDILLEGRLVLGK